MLEFTTQFREELTDLIKKHNDAIPNGMTNEFLACLMINNTKETVRVAQTIETHHKAMEYGDA